MYLKQEDIYYFNIDELEVYWTFSNYLELLKWINNSNSDYIEFLDFTLYKSDKLRDYNYKIDFFKWDIKCFAFYVWKTLNEYITTRDYLKVYWNAFKVLELYEIIDFIDIYIELDYKDIKKWRRNNTIKRFDIAIDVKKDIKNILKNFKKLSQKWASFHWNTWELETYYIWEYQKKLNKWLLIRIYDKVKDIKKKNKQKLYSDYLNQENLTRIELEFRNDITKFVDLNSLLDRSYIFNLLIKYIEKHTKIFDRVKTEDVKKLKRLNKKIDLDKLKIDKVLNQRYYSSFIWYWYKIKEIWLCPINILLRNCLIKESTINSINKLINKNKFNLENLDKINKCSEKKRLRNAKRRN